MGELLREGFTSPAMNDLPLFLSNASLYIFISLHDSSDRWVAASLPLH